MTKPELIELLEQVYATYNQSLPTGDEELKTLYNAWYELMHDLDHAAAKKAFLKIAVWAEFMPRPGQIRRTTLDDQTKLPPFDEPLVAWGKWMTVSKEAHSGMPPSVPIPEALRMTVQRIGESAVNMHTNSDREAFCKVYLTVVEELLANRYAVKPLPTKMTKPEKGN